MLPQHGFDLHRLMLCGEEGTGLEEGVWLRARQESPCGGTDGLAPVTAASLRRQLQFGAPAPLWPSNSPSAPATAP